LWQGAPFVTVKNGKSIHPEVHDLDIISVDIALILAEQPLLDVQVIRLTALNGLLPVDQRRTIKSGAFFIRHFSKRQPGIGNIQKEAGGKEVNCSRSAPIRELFQKPTRIGLAKDKLFMTAYPLSIEPPRDSSGENPLPEASPGQSTESRIF
jgi:hypothetical protein